MFQVPHQLASMDGNTKNSPQDPYGASAVRTWFYAPVAFIAAAIGIAPIAATYEELAGRFPVSSGEVAYMNAGFRSRWISILSEQTWCKGSECLPLQNSPRHWPL